MQDITTADFDSVIAQGTTLVDYWAPWCPPCLAMRPNLERVAREYEGRVLVVKVNVEAERTMLQRFDFTSIPVLILFRDGKEIARRPGAGGYAAIKEFLDPHLSSQGGENSL